MNIKRVFSKKYIILPTIALMVIIFIGIGISYKYKWLFFKNKKSETTAFNSKDGEVPSLVDLNEARLKQDAYKDSSEKLSDMETVAYNYYYANDFEKADNAINRVVSTFPEEKIDFSFYEMAGLMYKKKSDKAKSNHYFDLALKYVGTSEISDADKDEVTKRLNSERLK